MKCKLHYSSFSIWHLLQNKRKANSVIYTSLDLTSSHFDKHLGTLSAGCFQTNKNVVSSKQSVNYPLEKSVGYISVSIILSMEDSFDRKNYPSSFISRVASNTDRTRNKYGTGDDFIMNLSSQCFNKTYTFRNCGEWRIPEDSIDEGSSQEKWQIPELYVLKEKLNCSKGKLNTFNLGDWHKHTNYMNPAGLVLKYLKSFKIEFLTQAWCKFFEILCIFPVIPADVSGFLNSLHLCEAPGAFVAALNHYLKLNHPSIEWKWLANTLNPYYEGNSLDEMINDDRFIYGTLDKWWFGDDYTGNIHNMKTVESLKFVTDKLDPIHIITADGSVDCLRDPAEQEAHVSSLHYTEVVSALMVLSKGGSFVIKIFTLFECETICLIFILCSVFKNVSFHKPVVSKEGNSEVYVVCCDYIGLEKCENILKKINSFEQFDKLLFNKVDLPQDFIDQIVECSTFFTNLQINVLEKNVNSYQCNMSHKRRVILKRVRNSVAELFVDRFKISSLPQQLYILDNKSQVSSLNHVPKNEEGTFEERQELLRLDKKFLLLKYKEHLLSNEDVQWNRPPVCSFKLRHDDCNLFKPIKGKPISQVRSSKFCKGTFITIINDLNSCGCNVFKSNPETGKRLLELIPDMPSDYIICDVTHELCMSNFYKFQKEFLETLLAKLKLVSLGQSLIVIGLPLLTQFNVGIAYILGLSFSEIGFACPTELGYVLIYRNLLNPDFLLKFHELMDKFFLTDCAVLSLVPISLLCEGTLYSCITSVNHIALKDIALNEISRLLGPN